MKLFECFYQDKNESRWYCKCGAGTHKGEKSPFIKIKG